MRLTKAVKEAIVGNALAKFGRTAAEAELRGKYEALAERCRLYAIGGPEKEREYLEIEQKMLELCRRVPDELMKYVPQLDRRTTMRVSFAGMQQIVIFPAKVVAPSNITIPAEHELCARFLEIEAEKRALTEKIATLKITVQANINRFTTAKKLIEAWPEVVELIPEQPKSSVVNLPVVQAAQLNQLIGLPSGE